MESVIEQAQAFPGLSIEAAQRILDPAAKPEAGIACSVGNEGFDFLEVFLPRTRQEQEAQIYLDPGPFVR